MSRKQEIQWIYPKKDNLPKKDCEIVAQMHFGNGCWNFRVLNFTSKKTDGNTNDEFHDNHGTKYDVSMIKMFQIIEMDWD